MTANPTKDPMYFQFSEDGILLSFTFCFFFFLSFTFLALFDLDLLLDFLVTFPSWNFSLENLQRQNKTESHYSEACCIVLSI